MKKTTQNLLLTALIIALSTSCASIIHGSKQSVNFSSTPPGAKIVIDGKDYGFTPKPVELKRKGRLKGEDNSKKEYDIKIELDGYYPYEIKITREMDGWFLGNLLFGGLIGIIIDASNGAMYKLTPNQVIAQMGKATAMNYKEIDDNVYVAVTLDPDPNWERIGTLEKVELKNH